MAGMPSPVTQLRVHQKSLARCALCPQMTGPVVMDKPVASPVLLIGQAPGSKEIEVRRPFAWTAGKTLFRWFESIGLKEPAFRQRVYMAAVCRCFPGKNVRGGDRVPSPEEVSNCSRWLNAEIRILEPALILPVGKLAIRQVMPLEKLNDVVGQRFRLKIQGISSDVIPLPHPSGASTWHRMEPGKTLLQRALDLIAKHPAWTEVAGEG